MGNGSANDSGVRRAIMTTVGKLLGSIEDNFGHWHGRVAFRYLGGQFSDQLRSSRRHLQASVDEALEDGILSQDEIERLRGMGNDMGLRPETLDELIKYCTDYGKRAPQPHYFRYRWHQNTNRW